LAPFVPSETFAWKAEVEGYEEQASGSAALGKECEEADLV
jgi:hypothetical protein